MRVLLNRCPANVEHIVFRWCCVGFLQCTFTKRIQAMKCNVIIYWISQTRCALLNLCSYRLKMLNLLLMILQGFYTSCPASVFSWNGLTDLMDWVSVFTEAQLWPHHVCLTCTRVRSQLPDRAGRVSQNAHIWLCCARCSCRFTKFISFHVLVRI